MPRKTLLEPPRGRPEILIAYRQKPENVGDGGSASVGAPFKRGHLGLGRHAISRERGEGPDVPVDVLDARGKLLEKLGDAGSTTAYVGRAESDQVAFRTCGVIEHERCFDVLATPQTNRQIRPLERDARRIRGLARVLEHAGGAINVAEQCE